MSEFELELDEKKKKKPQKDPPPPPPPKPASLSGLWTFAQGDSLVPDQGAAIKKGHVISAGVPAPHGTYIKERWYRIYHETDYLFYLFDDNGDLAVFEFQTAENLKADGIKPEDFRHATMPEVWKRRPSTVIFEVKAGDEHLPQGRKLELTPHLALVDKDKVQPNLPGKWCPSIDETLNTPQYLYRDAIAKTFYWLPGKPDNDEEGLEFSPFDEPQSRRAPDPQSGFGDIFRGQSQFPSLDYPFFGFNPRAAGFGSKAKEIEAAKAKKQPAPPPPNLSTGLFSAGTEPLDYTRSNPQQGFLHVLLFEFPRYDSMDYERSQVTGQPHYPWGLHLKAPNWQWDHSHTVEISSTYDLTRSWSTTSGFNAGVEKMLSVGLSADYKEQLDTQTRQQSRYAISRYVTVKAIAWHNPPMLRLQSQFVDHIHSRLVEWLETGKVGWDNFVERFGSHYLHAVTIGSIHCERVHYSLAAEAKGREWEHGIKTEIDASFEGAKAGTNADFRSKLQTKFGWEFSEQDAEGWTVGYQDPAAIFFDLRPITELLNPIYVQYNPVDIWQKYSPFVWHGLRESLSDYLKLKGLNQPLEKDAGDDWSPRRVRMACTSWKSKMQWCEWGYPINGDPGMYLTGTVEFQPDIPPERWNKPSAEDRDKPSILIKMPRAFQGEQVALLNRNKLEGDWPTDSRETQEDKLYCEILTRRGDKARVKLHVNLDVKQQGENVNPPTLTSFSSYRTITETEEGRTTYDEGSNPPGRSVYFWMTFNLNWNEVKED
jgi:hypothetical protein